MRYLYIAVAVVFLFCAVAVAPDKSAAMCGMCDTAEKDQAGAVEKKAPLADDEEFGEDNRREMPQQENYDENTELPNVVDSDTNGEI